MTERQFFNPTTKSSNISNFFNQEPKKYDYLYQQKIPQVSGPEGGKLENPFTLTSNDVKVNAISEAPMIKRGPGRPKKYHTQEEKKEAIKASQQKYWGKPLIGSIDELRIINDELRADNEAIKADNQELKQNITELIKMMGEMRKMQARVDKMDKKLVEYVSTTDNRLDDYEDAINDNISAIKNHVTHIADIRKKLNM